MNVRTDAVSSVYVCLFLVVSVHQVKCYQFISL